MHFCCFFVISSLLVVLKLLACVDLESQFGCCEAIESGRKPAEASGYFVCVLFFVLIPSLSKMAVDSTHRSVLPIFVQQRNLPGN